MATQTVDPLSQQGLVEEVLAATPLPVATAPAVPYLYVGLSQQQRLAIIFSAIVVVVLNMLFGAYVMHNAAERVPFGDSDQKTVASFSSGISDPVISAVLRSKSIDAVANLKLVGNKQAIVIVAFAGAFSLVAIGFALFVLGSDGVFRVQGEGIQGARFLLAGTAPGLFCFVMAAVLIVAGILHRSELQLGETTFPADVAPAAQGRVPVNCVAGRDTDCSTGALFSADGGFRQQGERK